jgi:hypothetical protein
MDGSSKHGGKAMTAMVVRQFTPSRIERQLLAQVFELVCGPRWKAEGSACGSQNPAGTNRFRDAAHGIDTLQAGRRAA